MTQVRRWGGEHENSVWSRADAATKALIKRKRKEFLEQHAEIQAWGRNGCLGSILHSRSEFQDEVVA